MLSKEGQSALIDAHHQPETSPLAEVLADPGSAAPSGSSSNQTPPTLPCQNCSPRPRRASAMTRGRPSTSSTWRRRPPDRPALEPIDQHLPRAALHHIDEQAPVEVDDPGHIRGAPGPAWRNVVSSTRPPGSPHCELGRRPADAHRCGPGSSPRPSRSRNGLRPGRPGSHPLRPPGTTPPRRGPSTTPTPRQARSVPSSVFRALGLPAPPQPFRPTQHRGPATDRQVADLHLLAAVAHRPHPARRAADHRRGRLHRQVQLSAHDTNLAHHETVHPDQRGRAGTTVQPRQGPPSCVL